MKPTHYTVDTVIHPLLKGKRQEGHRQAIEGPFPFVGEFNRGEVLRTFMKLYGFCRGKIYVDSKSGGPPKEVGWVFEKKQKYDDSVGFYIQETWITLSQKCDCCGGSGQIV